jgi:hypothetical protein
VQNPLDSLRSDTSPFEGVCSAVERAASLALEETS